ncbi:MAG: hypothetical protein PUE30_10185 [Spirochaetia bacterium]|nr:hypothetical protein [Spirochaetia bacterium]
MKNRSAAGVEAERAPTEQGGKGGKDAAVSEWRCLQENRKDLYQFLLHLIYLQFITNPVQCVNLPDSIMGNFIFDFVFLFCSW